MKARAVAVALLTLVLICGAVPSALGQQLNEDTNERAAIQQVVDSYVQPFLAKHGIPGAIVGVSMHGHRYYFSYGTANDSGMRFSRNTLVEIGSCTKVFTTTLFALDIQRGQILPNASIARYMPRGFTLKPESKKATPLELADFTSGMPDEPNNLPPNLEMRSIRYYTTRDFLQWVSRWTPTAPPPAPYVYSNAGIGLLSYLMDDATHTRWNEQIHSEILRPLGMFDTEVQPSAEQKTRLALGHRPNGTPAPSWPVFAWYAAGSLRSTAEDMLSFGEANLGHRQVNGRSVPNQLVAAMNAAQKPVYKLPNSIDQQGMAWVTNPGASADLKPETFKNGGTVGFNSAILVNHFKDAALFIAVNRSGNNVAPLAVNIGRHLP
jgi:CubicO group peptidase (beta-lactamase class C family)